MAKFNLGNNNPLESSALFSTDQEAQEAPKKVGRPKKADVVRGNSVQEGLTKEYTRATFIVPVEQLERLKNYAYTERLTMKQAIELALTEFLDSEEARLAEEGQHILDRNGGNEE